jgi:hypothetical protein
MSAPAAVTSLGFAPAASSSIRQEPRNSHVVQRSALSLGLKALIKLTSSHATSTAAAPSPHQRRRFKSLPVKPSETAGSWRHVRVSAPRPGRLAICVATLVFRKNRGWKKRRESRLDCIAHCAPSRSYRPFFPPISLDCARSQEDWR